MFIEHKTTRGKAGEAQILARVESKATVKCLALPLLRL